MAAELQELSERMPVLDRVEQQRRFGMDCGDAIRFDAGTWAPGGEHVRKLTVRNVSKRSLKFKYELPSTKYFSMAFPTVITLSPGMLTVLDVAFRPVKLEEYDDFVGFHVHVIEGGVAAVSGRFRVPVVARIAALAVEIPHGVDFGFCPTHETTLQVFHLHNCGQIDALFDWTVASAGEHGTPFAVEPESGRVSAGSSVELTASFCPTSASVYVMTTACTVRPDTNEAFAATQKFVETMKISGISKFTHLSASETELNFGEVLVGAPNTSRAPTEKEFVLRNRSLVRASFTIVNVESDHDPRFIFSPLRGVVAAESTVTIKVRYTPLSAGTFTCDHFDILTPGGNRVRITCKGRATGPLLSIWRKNPASNFEPTRSVNFQDVSVGGAPASRVITLRNESPLEVFFHFDAQPQGIFQFDQVNGKIAPYLDLNVTITFAPTHSGNFYRRFFLLVHNQSTRFVDVLGTGYDDKTRPSPFQQAHIDAYRLRVEAGLGRLSPDQLERYHEENGDALFLKSALQAAKAEEALRKKGQANGATAPLLPPPSQILARSGEASLAEVEVCSEYFVSIEEKLNPIVVLGALLDFGNCGIVQFPSKKLLHVTNNTHSKVTCTWRVAVAATASETKGEQDRTFQVFPQSSDIAAGDTAEFRVGFQPARVNTYYFAELEAFVAFKSNRTFRLVNVDTFTPPWCVVTKVCGNTFASPTEQFLSKISFRLSKNKVAFPPCYLGDSVFQTILMENASDTPALFSFVEDPAEVFLCKPMCGYIEAKSFHLVAIRFTPRSVQKYTHLLQCVVNSARAKPELLELTGICALPQLSFQDSATETEPLVGDTKIFVKPTAVGLQSRRQIELLNTSRVPLVYRWELPAAAQTVFRVTPKLGRLNGRESDVIECSFAPDEIREYASRFLVGVKSISVPLNQRKNAAFKLPLLQELTVRVQTKGTIGAILFEPETLQFETILVNTNAKQSFFLENTADCDLTYSLRQSVEARTRTKCADDDENSDGGGENNVVSASFDAAKLVFSEGQGCIPAQSRKKITATFLPTAAGTFTFHVSCIIGDESKSSPYDTWGFHQHKQAACVITAEASFPTIEIQDLRVPGVSTQLAWHQFQCNEINRYLSAPLSSEEEGLGRSTSAGHECDSTKAISTPESAEDDEDATVKRFVLPFSPAPTGSRTERVFFKLRNPGSLVVQYHLRYPKEGNVEIEHWAETGTPSTEEVRLNAIIDSKVFGISPRRATLLPRQSILLTLSYAYTSEAYGGVHHLPMFLEVDKGKKMILELQGRTLTHSDPKLFVPARVFHLSPVTIGEFRRGFLPPRGVHSIRTADTEASSEEVDRQRHQARLRMGGPPVQQLEIFNRGDSAFRLDIGSAALDRVNAANQGYPVFSCGSSSEIVPARSSIFLDLEFNPIEAGTLETQLVLQAHGLLGKGYHEVVEVTVVATGFHPQHWTLPQLQHELWAALAPPKQQSLCIADLPACFVSDFLDFGHVAMHSRVNQLLVLQNQSVVSTSPAKSNLEPRVFTFEWDTTHPLVADGTLVFSPKHGELAPGETALIRVSVHATGDALVVNHDVACWITYRDEDEDSPISNNAASASPTKLSGPSTLSGLASNQRSRSEANKTLATRTSVINRSTATQEATTEKTSVSSPLGKTATINGRVDTPSRSPTAPRGSNSIAGDSRNSSRKSSTKSMRKESRDRTSTSASLVASESRRLESLVAVEQRATPLFVRIYAHMLPLVVMERIYSRTEVKKLPLLSTKPLPRVLPAITPTPVAKDVKSPSSPPTRSSRGGPSTPSSKVGAGRAGSGKTKAGKTGSTTPAKAPDRREAENAAAQCRDVLYDVMEELLLDVLASGAVQEALEEQLTPMPRADRALRHASVSKAPGAGRGQPPKLHPQARQSDDCQAILAGVMENAVHNILQELFHGDLEHQLLCVPRKTVFPNASVSGAAAAASRRSIPNSTVSNGQSPLKV